MLAVGLALAPVRGAFYYIANAQLERLGDDQTLGAGAGERSVVLRLPLGNACDR